jgi:hypothetical protein
VGFWACRAEDGSRRIAAARWRENLMGVFEDLVFRLSEASTDGIGIGRS